MLSNGVENLLQEQGYNSLGFARLLIFTVMKRTKIRLGGVPEHFNLPVHLAIESGEFLSRDVDVEWITYKGGTGQMVAALETGEVDACILLTEGVIKAIVNGLSAKIVSNYINTPLTWGVHTAADNPLIEYDRIFDKRYAISRFGSGSHLMPIVDANTKNKDIEKEQFVVIKNLEGAVESLVSHETDVFYWEKFTTKPLVDKGVLRRIGEYQTPWPCFVIACRDSLLETEGHAVTRMLRVLHDRCDRFMEMEDAIDLVSERYDQQRRDVERWYHSTEWAIHGWVSDKMLKSVIYYLRAAEILSPDQHIPELIWKR